MARIEFDMSSVEARNRFSEAVSDMLDLTETLTDKFLEKTKDKARALNLARPDYHDILLKLLYERGGVGFTCSTTKDGGPALMCLSCNSVTREVNWRCDKCDSPLMEEVLSDFSCPITGMEFVLVKGGVFQMGDIYASDEDGSYDELPVHSVWLDGYFISKTPVTCEQYALFIADTHQTHPTFSREYPNVSIKHDDMSNEISGVDVYANCNSNGRAINYPITQVSWHDAAAFARWASTKMNRKIRLPTEAEWEFAARSRQNRDKWSGTCTYEEVDDYVWSFDNSDPCTSFSLVYGSTKQVGRKKPNALGLYDMSGNVWEWCQDWHERYYYEHSPDSNPQGPAQGFYRSLRGGSWNECRKRTRISAREFALPEISTEALGFRLVCEFKQ